MDDLEGINQLALAWNSGWNNADVEALLALYTDEPVLLPQGQPALTGKEAIRFAYEAVFKDFIIHGQGKLVRAEASGNLGYFWSSYSLVATPRAGGVPTTSRGKSIFIVKLQADQSWKIACLMDSSDEET